MALRTHYIDIGYLPKTATTTLKHMAREWRKEKQDLLNQAEQLLD